MVAVVDGLINYENYRNLAVGVIRQAALDYQYILKQQKKYGLNGLILAEKRVGRKDGIEQFFMDNGLYFNHAKLDGPLLLKTLQSNFAKYGRCLLRDDEWEIIEKGDKLCQ